MSGDTKLSPEHLRTLRDESGINDDVIETRGYRSITDTKELAALGFAPKQQLVPGLWMPGFAPDGSNGFGAYKPDFPRQARNSKGDLLDKFVKYEMPKGASMRLDVPPICHPQLLDPSIPLWVTEGIKKADSLASRGLCALCLYGVWNLKGKNQFSGITVLADFDFIAWNNRDVRIVFDSDIMHKPEVRKALERLTEILQRKGAHVSAVYLPGGRDSKVGVDDFLREHTVEELEALVDAPRPQPQPAPPTIELLEDEPLIIRRPLALVNGRAFAATWPYVKKTETESQDKSGNIVKLNPPLEKTMRRLFIVRSDGAIFGEGGTHRMDELGLEHRLNEIPGIEKLWSARGVKAYKNGHCPQPKDVFTRIVECVSRFIDFNKSLADQRAMAEMVACYVLSTWFLDAFNVAGNIWPNGERGSGKTQLLITVAKLSYLGQVILASASFAALRDMANYGAFLAFDDAENLSDPKKTDPDKRTLLLAGNRRGNTVAMKVQGADKTWVTEYVDTYSPRAFSAIRLPDSTLASRTIIVPLIRTPDRYRANADPSDDEAWPHNQRQLLDDLWALSLSHLPALPAYEKRVNEEARLTGRNLEPWRSLLAVALWLDENGFEGLWSRMEQLSVNYQEERGEMESGDQTSLVIRALCRCAISAINAKSAINSEGGWVFTTEEIKDAVIATANDAEADVDVEKFTSKRIGRTLGKMRLSQSPRPGGRGSRRWIVSIQDLERWTSSYGMSLADFVTYDGSTLRDLLLNGTNGTDGTNGTSEIFAQDSIPENETEEEAAERAAVLDYIAGDSRPIVSGVPQWQPDGDPLERM
jgi:hypothetical protein